MATNPLGSAFVRIVPQMSGWDRVGEQIRRQFDPVLTQVNRISAGLDQAGDAGRRAAGNLGEIGDAARRASGDVDQLRGDLDQAGQAGADAAEQTESGWTAALGRITGGAKTAFGAAGVAAAAAFGAGLAGALEQQEGTNRLQASLGLSDEEAARLGKVAGSLYADAYGESLGEVKEAITVVVRDIEGMGTASSAVLEEFTGKALSVADVMQHDVADVSRAVATIMANDLAPSADAALDVIARGTQLGGNRADDLLDTFSEYSPLFAQLGLSADQSMGLLVQGLRGGARDTDFLADAIKEMTLLVQEMPEATSTAFADLGLDAGKFQADIAAGGDQAAGAFGRLMTALRDVKDPVDQNRIAVGLFGTKAEDLQNALFAMDPTTAVAALGQVGGAATQLDEDLNKGVKVALTTVKRTIETGLWEAAGVALPPLASLATTVSANVGPAFDTAKVGVRGFFSALSGEGVTSDGFVGGMERAGVVVRDIGETASKAWQLVLPGLRDLGSLVTGSVWPALQDLWAVAKGLWPDVQAIGQLVATVLLVAFRALAAVLANVIGPALAAMTGFWRSNQTTITALAVAIGVGVVAWYAYRGAVVAVETAQYLWQVRTLLMQAVMRSVQGGMAALRTATLLLNTAFLANPIGIIIVALVALAAGIAYAWTHSETFRNVVTGAWNAVRDATMTALGAVRDFFVAVWNGMWGVVGPVVGAIVTIVTGAWNIISTVTNAVWTAIRVYFQTWWTVISAVFSAALEVIKVVLSVAWTVISAVITAAWTVIKFYFQTWWAIVSTLFGVALDAIKAVLSAAWSVISAVINVAWGAIQAYFRVWWTVVSTVFSTALNALKVVFDVAWGAIRTATSTVWDTIKTIFSTALGVIRTTTDTVMGLVKGGFDTALGGIKTAFQTTKDGIKTIWDGLKAVAAAPVRFVVDTVYNNGIRRAWNSIVAKIPGVPEMGALNVPGLAAGGPITGGTPGRDSVLRWLMPGEHVLTKGEVAAAGGHGRIFALRAALGGGTQAGAPGMALGGIVGDAWDATGGRVVSGLADLAQAGLAKAFEAVITPLRGTMNATLGRGDNWKGIINRLIQSPFDKLIEWVRGKEAEAVPDVGPAGAGVHRWSAVASSVLSAAGQSQSWLPLLLKRMNQESGGNPTAVNRWDSNWKAGTPSVGLMQVIGPTFRAHAGAYAGKGPFMYGTSVDPFANIYAATRYTMSRYGSLSAWNRPGGYDQGGPLHPGWTMAYNGTGHDEWVSVHRPNGGGGTATLTLNVDARQATDPAAVEAAARRASADLLEGLDRMLQQGEGDI